MDLLTLMMNYIGYLTPIILFVLSIFLLVKKITYLEFYILGVVLNNILVVLLKNIFREPRPNQEKSVQYFGKSNDKLSTFDKYGMPSGHLQNCGYSVSFITFVLKNPFITTLYIIISMICLFQRVLNKNHTISQVSVGLIIGLGFGYLIYLIANKYIQGNIKSKPDDDAFI